MSHSHPQGHRSGTKVYRELCTRRGVQRFLHEGACAVCISEPWTDAEGLSDDTPFPPSSHAPPMTVTLALILHLHCYCVYFLLSPFCIVWWIHRHSVRVLHHPKEKSGRMLKYPGATSPFSHVKRGRCVCGGGHTEAVTSFSGALQDSCWRNPWEPYLAPFVFGSVPLLHSLIISPLRIANGSHRRLEEHKNVWKRPPTHSPCSHFRVFAQSQPFLCMLHFTFKKKSYTMSLSAHTVF